MTLKTPGEYLESIKKDLNLYMFGEKIEKFWEHPIIIPTINSTKRSYELAQIPEYQDLMLTKSHMTGETINRFSHIHHSVEDLIKKVQMQRLMGNKTGCCFARCPGMDAANAMYSVTFDIDKKYGTNYHEKFKKYWLEVQQQDLVVDGAMTDPKGDRSKRPKDQPDPDHFLHVVEERDDGVVVKGAKIHQTGLLNSHRVLVMPTLTMRPGEEEYAICFGLDTNDKGLTMIYGRQSCDTRKMEEIKIDVGNQKYGMHEIFMIFEDVFIPNERIFMKGEIDFAGEIVQRFAGFHRQSYGGCKSGVGDTLIGAAALAAEYSGVDNASHIKDKLVEMIHLNETLYACGVACSALGFQREAGNYEEDMLIANVCKQNVTRFPYDMARYAEDIAGGIIMTLPSAADFNSEEIGPLLKKYLSTCEDISVEERFKVLRFIESMTYGQTGVSFKGESLHGAGSPQAQRIMIARQAGIDKKIDLVKEILDIK